MTEKTKANNSATKLLLNQYKGICNDPVEGFAVELEDENDLFRWKIYIEGPKDTPYEGGVFQLRLAFPQDYPMSPPTLKFLSDFWHPNVHLDGKVCISILHPPGEDVMSGERPGERWLPTQTVTTIMLSVISLLNDPNTSSPANVDASVEWRKDRLAYRARCQKLAQKANQEKPAHVVIPHPDTDATERARNVEKMKILNSSFDIDDFAYDEGDMDGDEYDDEEGEDEEEDEDGEGMEDEEEEKETVVEKKAEKLPLERSVEEKKVDSRKLEIDSKGKGKEKEKERGPVGAEPVKEPAVATVIYNSPSPLMYENSTSSVSTNPSSSSSSSTSDPSSSSKSRGKTKKAGKGTGGRKKDKCIVM